MLLVDKPPGLSSHDVVTRVRRVLGVRRIGHAGTLDPFATGLLVLLIGRATRLLRHITLEPKEYNATIRLGAETDTDDCTGAVTRSANLPSRPAIDRAIGSLTGSLEQIPPAYSAKQIAGRRAYAAARRGERLDLKPVRVTVHGWTLHDCQDDVLRASVVCSGGTYVRALARDLGRLSGSAAHLAALERLRSGPFHVARAVRLDSVRAETKVSPPLEALPDLPVTALNDEALARVVRGMPVEAPPGSATWGALLDTAGELVAVAERVGTRWQPRVVLRDA